MSIVSALKKARAGNHFATRPLQSFTRVTPDIFGKLLVAAWAAQSGGQTFPNREVVTQAILSKLPSVPSVLHGVLHPERRADGSIVIAELSDFLLAAQGDGLIKRFNPDLVRISVEIDQPTGNYLLDAYTNDHPDLREWFTEVASQLIQAKQGSVKFDRSDGDQAREAC